MFFKKKIVKPEPNYTTWEADFGFLNLILSRKKNITKEYLIGIYSEQKSKSDYLNDEELAPPIESVVSDVFEQIGDEYKNFLVRKYFGSVENLLKYITEDVYVDLTTYAINRNVAKIKSTLQKRVIEDLNKKQ